MEYPTFADRLSVKGKKRDVCVDEPDLHVPAVRFRSVYWHGSVISARTTGAASY